MEDRTRHVSQLSEHEHQRLAHIVMRRQALLSLRVAAVFLALILGLPMVNAVLPQMANMNVQGFPVTWLFLGVLFFPLTWLLSAYFVRASNRLEDECEDWRTVLNREAGWSEEEDDR